MDDYLNYIFGYSDKCLMHMSRRALVRLIREIEKNIKQTEIKMFKHKGVEIWYNLHNEYEYTVGDCWYSTLEKAKEAIDKGVCIHDSIEAR